MSSTPEQAPFPDKLINFAGLRVQCLRALYLNPLEQWNQAEHAQVLALIPGAVQSYFSSIWDGHTWGGVSDKQKVDFDSNEGLKVFLRDFDPSAGRPPIPKWVALVGWLAPESAMAVHSPALLASIIKIVFSKAIPLLPEDEYDLQ